MSELHEGRDEGDVMRQESMGAATRKRRVARRAVYGVVVGTLLAGLGVAWATENLGNSEIDRAMDQAPLSPAPPLGGPSSAGLSQAAPIPVGSLRPVYTETDFQQSSAVGDFAFTRTFSASTEAGNLSLPEEKLPTPFGRVMNSNNTVTSLRWSHNLFSYVVFGRYDEMDPSGLDYLTINFCTIRTPWGAKIRFESCHPDMVAGSYATHYQERDVKLRWDGDGFTLLSPEGRFRYTLARSVASQTRVLPPRYIYTTAYFLTEVEPVSYGSPVVQSGPAGRRVLASLTYHTGAPSGCVALSPSFGTAGPLVQYATLANGSRLAFNYGSFPTRDPALRPAHPYECILTSVNLEEGTSGTGQGTRNVVTYDYQAQLGQTTPPIAGELSGALHGVGSAQSVPAGAEVPVPLHMTYSWQEISGTPVRMRWKVLRNDVLVTSKLLDKANGYVVNEEDASQRILNVSAATLNGPYCGPGRMGGTCGTSQLQAFNELIGIGTGSATPDATHLTRLFAVVQVPARGAWTTSSYVTCGYPGGDDPSSCRGLGRNLSPLQQRSWGIQNVELDTLDFSLVMTRTAQDSRGGYTVYTNGKAVQGDALPTQVPYQTSYGFVPPGEVKAIAEGATAADGSGALLSRSYTYDYGRAGTFPGYEQRVKTESSQSAMAGQPGVSESASWIYQYEAGTNRLMAKIRKGYTWNFMNGFSNPEIKYLATFYRTYRAFCGETPAAADPQARTVEVQGPCWVGGENATECMGSAPVTQYFYGAPNASNGQQQQLTRKRVFTLSVAVGSSYHCQNTPFEDTTYDAYDDQGRLLRMTEPNGVQTHLAYSAGKLVRKTVKAGALADLVTDYGYDDNSSHGDYIRHPDGRYEIQCYRSGTWPGTGCSGGVLTDKLQWKATASSATGVNYSERVNYGYRRGRLATEEVLAPGGVVRSRRTYDDDPLGRPTYQGFGEMWGEGPGSNISYSIPQLFDSEDNLIRQGLPYLSNSSRPPAFCGGFNTSSGALNTLPIECRSFAYDRLNRLVSMMDAAGTQGTAPTVTHISYNGVGKIQRVKQGCAAGSTEASCISQPALEYLYDDFGNLLEAKAPWGAAATPGYTPAPSVVRFAYNAQGQPVVRQTSSMAQNNTWALYASDALGRLVFTDMKTPTTTVRLAQYWYAGQAPSVPSGCPAAQPGQMHVMVDSFGTTWFAYDAFGRVSAKLRVRGEQYPLQACNTSPFFSGKDSPNHFFNYDAAGRLVGEIYPYGRGIEYRYHAASTGMPHRISAIYAAHLYPDGGSGNDPLITDITWEPYGGLGSYKIHRRGEAGVPAVAEVRYHRGGNNGSILECSAASFSQAVDGPGGPMGRLSGVSVTRNTLGDVFKRVYRYYADQTDEEATCILKSGSTDAASVQRYRGSSGLPGYDAKMQVVRATSTTLAGNTFLAMKELSYSYDARGNRTAETQNGFGVQSHYTSPLPHVDQLTHRMHTAPPCPAGQVGCLPYGVMAMYQYDRAGRMDTARWYRTSLAPQPYYTLNLNARASSSVELDGVYRQVLSTQDGGGGINYEYFYDATGRRRLKRSWDGREDEYFYADTRLLVDVGQVGSDPNTTDYVLDEYVWLDNRPVALIKSRFAHSPFLRVADNTTDCARFGQESDVPCGTYFPVSDGLGKPILLLDSQGRVSGVGDYDPFGQVNRVAHYAAARDAYDAPIAALQAPARSGLVTQVRARVEWAESYGQGGIFLANADGGNLVGGVNGWVPDGVVSRTTTIGWVPTPADGRFYVWMRPETWDYLSAEVHLSGFEYRQFESGAKPVWLPLRLPGQYFDPETDLFENRNRYYDPNLGRYTAPEPMLTDPSWVAKVIAKGVSPAVYAYANNNPIAMADPDGLQPFLTHDQITAAWVKGIKNINALQEMIKKIEADPNYKVEFKVEKWAKGNKIDQHAGAYSETAIDKNGKAIGTTIHYDPDYIQSPEGQERFMEGLRHRVTGYVMDRVSGISVDEALAHELGHAYGYFAGCTTESCINRSSMRWENFVRQSNGSGVRTYHKSSQFFDWLSGGVNP
ncbi:RHS repeat family [Corallococcus coralloides]|uniref:RHS repeat family n=1 Tax=Corallococcus coralloides TaxID=184914 RepID=A0A410RJC8_CORCK|nr:RHS repeat-associated core domain-containing protein [Corallococcus coralloides]QAT82027.1 RHS repeat family [Corallococcus coralloides]